MTRQWISIVVLMFATVGHAGKVEAGYYTGSELLAACEADDITNVICTGYLAGINDITNTYDAWGEMDKQFCIPDSATLGQLKKVVIKGLNEMPENLHLNASGPVAIIFYKAFPCD